MDCQVIDAILRSEQRVREEDFMRRQLERDCGVLPRENKAPWQAVMAFVRRNRQAASVIAGQGTTAHSI